MTNWTLSKALVKRVAKAIQAAATGNWMEDGEARAYARAALDASPIGELVDALTEARRRLGHIASGTLQYGKENPATIAALFAGGPLEMIDAALARVKGTGGDNG